MAAEEATAAEAGELYAAVAEARVGTAGGTLGSGGAGGGGRADAMRALLTSDVRTCVGWDLVVAERATGAALRHLPNTLVGAHAEVLHVFFSLARRVDVEGVEGARLLAPFFPRVRIETLLAPSPLALQQYGLVCAGGRERVHQPWKHTGRLTK